MSFSDDSDDSDVVVISTTFYRPTSNQKRKRPLTIEPASSDTDTTLISPDIRKQHPSFKPKRQPKVPGSHDIDVIHVLTDTEKDTMVNGTLSVVIPNSLPFAMKTQSVLHLKPADIARLKPQVWFNDILMDFGLSQALRRHQLSESPLQKLWVFSTFFFKTFTKSGYEEVRKWSIKWDVFAQELIIIPVHKALHWCIVIVCNPAASILPANKNPVYSPRTQIISMDSLGSTQAQARIAVADWLHHVAQPHLNDNQWVPIQPNNCDCGPYSIHNLSRFLMNHTRILQGDISVESHDWQRIWQPHLASHMRTSLKHQVRVRSQGANIL
ncbi:hypothetical protein M422DRAFT_248681 [Sphaerobolus stellatus SS14]|nr:hypothetical protein M422DRAFT_248681 [Sphaerobolus stellatus SS14]